LPGPAPMRSSRQTSKLVRLCSNFKATPAALAQPLYNHRPHPPDAAAASPSEGHWQCWQLLKSRLTVSLGQ
jgi:hypothetical protein